MKKIYDISMKIHAGMPVYKDKAEKRPEFEVTADYERGARETRLHMDLHCGTHIDAPKHMVKGSNPITEYRVEDMMAPAQVVDLTHIDGGISIGDLEPVDIADDAFLLLKTKNSFNESFNFNFVFLDTSGARFLAKKDIRGIGIDSLGIERSQPDHSTHKALFESGKIIIEGLRLKDVPEGLYKLIAAPLPIEDGDASPVRALLVAD